ncbi:MAG TPA: bifunctional anthranilate synthase component II/anthranilate phosphoribosyltransferase [Desulfomonilaceae bacterium]|nr:bifunctional anthranilate synthase component II/anthranilate phosphoribosyltransferase [Desulfomonilaceae bacterium]
MILVIDNYDSFTFNLVQYFQELGEEVLVRRNDMVTVEEISTLRPRAVVISPGPGGPADAGISLRVLRTLGDRIPMFGVCLGHQAIAEAFGGRVISAPRLMHGKTSPISYRGNGLFAGMENPFQACRYHSLIVEKETLPECLEITALTDQDEIMGIRHKSYPIEGVQFHPESILTPDGKQILRNFLKLTDEFHARNSGAPHAGLTGNTNSTHDPTTDSRKYKSVTSHKEVPMFKNFIKKTTAGEHLTQEEMESAMESIMSGTATGAQIGSLLTALKMKGETVSEITGAARVMRRKALAVTVEDNGTPLIDTCGTGGDGAGTYNISTTVAFILAGSGVRVAKHGNRCVSSSCGSADVLRELGADLAQPPETVGQCIKKTGFGFLFAPSFHLAMKYAAGPRQEMGIRTLFNLLGPLTNPAGASCQLLGVYDPELTEPIAFALRGLGMRSAMVVHGMDGLDEISISGPTKISRLNGDTVTTMRLNPSELGLSTHTLEEISGGSVGDNARHLTDVLEGKPGPRRDVALLNAAAALLVADRVETLPEGLAAAARAVDSGAARHKLSEFLEFRA